MILPYIKIFDSVDVLVTIEAGMSDNGVPIILDTFTGKCNFSEKSVRVYDSDGQAITLEGKAIIGGDVTPNIEKPEGKVKIGNTEYKIHKFGRFRNPNGSIHHCELELI